MSTNCNNELDGALIIGAEALQSVGAMARAILHEIDRGPGQLDACLIVSLLQAIDYRAADAQETLMHMAEQAGLDYTGSHARLITRAINLSRSPAA